ncbi:MAG: F0F1 ATP synthase subunit delta [Candidatus Beckwithbacteria bacterium]|nr:F0F1 ATP synthase subunit delta [Candidatus Beckwithbacteria bacterium]
MKDDNRVTAIVEGIIDYLKSIKSLDLLQPISQSLQEASWIKTDPDLAKVYSRVNLTETQFKLIKTYLSNYFKRPIRVKTYLDSSIIAGFRIKIAGRIIDATINRRLEELKTKVLYD